MRESESHDLTWGEGKKKERESLWTRSHETLLQQRKDGGSDRAPEGWRRSRNALDGRLIVTVKKRRSRERACLGGFSSGRKNNMGTKWQPINVRRQQRRDGDGGHETRGVSIGARKGKKGVCFGERGVGKPTVGQCSPGKKRGVR